MRSEGFVRERTHRREPESDRHVGTFQTKLNLTYYWSTVLKRKACARALCLCLARNPGAGVSARSRPTTHTMSATLPFAPAADETEMDYSDMAEALGEFGVAAPKVDAYALMEDSRPAIPLPNGSSMSRKKRTSR